MIRICLSHFVIDSAAIELRNNVLFVGGETLADVIRSAAIMATHESVLTKEQELALFDLADSFDRMDS